ncbi:PAS domain-containing protein, partial [bacterium]|nr:PAS domain-containing protein [bacterium]
MKIGRKISLSFIIIMMIIFSCSASVIYIEARHNLKSSIYSNLLTAIQTRSVHIQSVLDDYMENCKITASEITSLDTADNHNNVYQINSKIKDILQNNDDICKISVLDNGGRIIATTHDNTGIYMEDDIGFFNGSCQGVCIKDPQFDSHTGSFALPVVSPIMADGEYSGMLILFYKAHRLFRITLNNTGLGETGEMYLINSKGYMITPSRFFKDAVLKQKVDTDNSRNCFSHMIQPETRHEEVKVFRNYRGIDCLGAHIFFPETKWGLIAEISEDEALSPLRRIRIIFLLLIICIPVIVWMTGQIVSKSIASPIMKLLEATRIIGNGDLDHKVGTDADDEIGELSRAFDTMIEDLKQSATSISILNREIEERKKAEDALKKSEKRYRSLVETLPAVTYIAAIDDTSSTSFVSPQIFDFVGYKQEEYMADPDIWIKRLHPDDRDRVIKEVKESHEKNIPFVSEYRMIAKDGRIVWIRDEAGIVCDDEGAPLFLQGIMLDVTEMKLTEQILKDSEEKYRSIFDQARDGIVLIDMET